jgi:hypothetical protein
VIHDPRLSEWLEFKIGRERSGREPMLLTMVPSGLDTFLVKPGAAKKADPFGSEVTPQREAKSERYFPVGRVPALASRSVA